MDSTSPLINIKIDDIRDLLKYFYRNTYRSKEQSETTQKIQNTCQALWNLDYECIIIPNTGGELCGSYPSQLIVPEKEILPVGDPPVLLQSVDVGNGSTPQPTISVPCPLNLPSPSVPPNNGHSAGFLSFSAVVTGHYPDPSVGYDSTSKSVGPTTSKPPLFEISKNSEESTGSVLRELILKARAARCRARFPIPVILCNGNYICRSSTLSAGVEMFGRHMLSNAKEYQNSSDWLLFNRVRAQDIKLLKAYNTNIIVDLMVEKKKVKFGMHVTSSEKVDKENRYSDFSILSLPYPGCEFFRDFRENNYTAEGLLFDWSQSFVDAQLVIPERTISGQLTSDWKNYRKWDLVKLTQNYLKLLIAYLYEGSNSGLLVHCISGWDRTPLFISLLRISLWADGAIHSSLDTSQMLYLTIAYDWFLFGHDLRDRRSKGEDIFFFCFDFLKYIMTDEFAHGRRRHISGDSYTSDRLESLSSAGSSNSLNSCSSKSSHSAHPSFIKVGRPGIDLDSYNVNNSRHYGSFSDNDFDFPSNKNQHTSPSAVQTSAQFDPVTEDEMVRLVRDMNDASPGYDYIPMKMIKKVIKDKKEPIPNKSNISLLTGRGTWGRSSLRDSDNSVRSSKNSSSKNCDCSNPNCLNTRSCNGGARGGYMTCHQDCERPIGDCTMHRNHNNQSESSSESFGSLTDLSPSVGSSSSPVAVPCGRTRKDSSNSAGSWQLVSGTGSLKGSTGSYFPNSGSSINSKASKGSGTDMVDSSNTIQEESFPPEMSSSIESDKSILVFNREERLKSIRLLFYRQFCQALGIKFPENSESWESVIKTFAEKIGISSLS